MTKIKVTSPDAPVAVGPYSQAIVTGNLVFTSGQIPIDPKVGRIVATSIEEQTRQVMSNLQAVLAAAGTNFQHVVKTTIFLVNLANFKAVNEVYGSFFKDTPPARSTVQVASLPLNAQIEIEMIAWKE